MKVVINICFGGFGLSPLAQKEYLKLKGKECFFYKQTKYNFQDKRDEYTRCDKPTQDSHSYHTFTKDHGKTFSNITNDDDSYWYYYKDIERNDPDLVKVVEKLGEKANGSCAKLRVVEIPSGIDWEISDYYGNESIEEKHRSWR
jgi:hypothetical protein